MKRAARRLVEGLVAALVVSLFVCPTNAGRVDLRGYGTVEAKITPERSEFVCENEEKADIVLGKLLADLFWDAGQNHTVTTAQIGKQDVPVHQWAQYGAFAVGRNGDRVVAVGAADVPTAEALARNESTLTSGKAVFAPANGRSGRWTSGRSFWTARARCTC